MIAALSRNSHRPNRWTQVKFPEKYTCTHYREEMILLGLKRRLAEPDLPEAEKHALVERIRRLEQEMGMD